MDKSLKDNILNICNVLNKHSVQYLIVGGVAVALHGYFRISTDSSGLPADKHDLDFWYNPTYDNYFALLNALAELGQDVEKFQKERVPNPAKSFFKLDFEKFTLDFIPELKGLTNFRSSFKNREIVIFDEIEISYMGYEDLIKEKEINPRPKDVDDIEQLKFRRNKTN